MKRSALAVLLSLTLFCLSALGQSFNVTQAPAPKQSPAKNAAVCTNGSCSVASSTSQSTRVYSSTSGVRHRLFSGRRSKGSCSNCGCR